MKTIFVCGSREIEDISFVHNTLDKLFEKPYKIIVNGNRGVAAAAVDYAHTNKIEYVQILPDWEEDGRYAAFMANERIFNEKLDSVIMILSGQDNQSEIDSCVQLAIHNFVPLTILFSGEEGSVGKG
ncbi:DUF2493 domain-containing protein [Candidatus Dojkabacteria bacterium]|jgi:hypothetical protein|nr:DUF2493 domain-containing protein [Candidatus Dojkabacteria bacterium]